MGVAGLGLLQGFAFGTGYGAGVRFGYEDVYPYLKNNMGAISQMLDIPFASSGFKLASGVTAHQGQGMMDLDANDAAEDKPLGLHDPVQVQGPGTPDVSFSRLPPEHIIKQYAPGFEFRVIKQGLNRNSDRYQNVGTNYRVDSFGRAVPTGQLAAIPSKLPESFYRTTSRIY